MSEPRWRVGRKLGRTLYRDNICVGMVDSPEVAGEIVAAMNAAALPGHLRGEACRNFDADAYSALCFVCGFNKARHAAPASAPTVPTPCMHPTTDHGIDGCVAHVLEPRLPGGWDYCPCDSKVGTRCGGTGRSPGGAGK